MREARHRPSRVCNDLSEYTNSTCTHQQGRRPPTAIPGRPSNFRLKTSKARIASKTLRCLCRCCAPSVTWVSAIAQRFKVRPCPTAFPTMTSPAKPRPAQAKPPHFSSLSLLACANSAHAARAAPVRRAHWYWRPPENSPCRSRKMHAASQNTCPSACSVLSAAWTSTNRRRPWITKSLICWSQRRDG